MKTFLIIFLFFQCFFALAQSSVNSQPLLINYKLPEDVRFGENYYDILREYPDYHFKFYKKSEEKFSFAMLGYWYNKNGCVLLFNNDVLMHVYDFVNLNEYLDFITNPDEMDNIQIISENLILK
jgi:hypothetical protein